MRVLGGAPEEIRRRRGNGGFRAIENPGVALMIIRVASGEHRIPIRADERGGGNAPTAIRNREHPPLLGNKARNTVTGLNYAPCFSLNSVQELSLYVGPECDPIRMPEALREGLPKILSKDVSRRFAVPEVNCVRCKGDPCHAILDAKFVKGAKSIGPELQSRTNLTDFRGALVDLY